MIQIDSYTPTELLSIAMDGIKAASQPMTAVRGVFKKGNAKPYSGYYYDSVCDESGTQSVSLRIPSEMRESLTEGCVAEFAGLLTAKTRGSSVDISLQVTRCSAVQEHAVSEQDITRARIRSRKAASGFRKADQDLQNILLSGRKPEIALVYADSSITDADFDQGLRGASDSFSFTERRVPFTRTDRFVAELNRISASGTYDAVCIIRGGGSGLDELDAPELLEAVADCRIPVIAAVGHTKDNVFINEISDHVCGTPSLLGSWLRGLTENVAAMRTGSCAAAAKEAENRYAAQMKAMQDCSQRTERELREQMDRLDARLRRANGRNLLLGAVTAVAIAAAFLL